MPHAHVGAHTRQGKPVRAHGRNIKERTAIALKGNQQGGELSSITKQTAILGGLTLAALLQFFFSLTITILLTAITVILAILTWETTKKYRRYRRKPKSKYATSHMLWKLRKFKMQRWFKRKIGKHRETRRMRRNRLKPKIMRPNASTSTMGYVTAKSAKVAAEHDRNRTQS